MRYETRFFILPFSHPLFCAWLIALKQTCSKLNSIHLIPSQLEFRFTRKLESPWPFHLTVLPCSAPPCFTTILSSLTPFNSAFFDIYLTPRISSWLRITIRQERTNRENEQNSRWRDSAERKKDALFFTSRPSSNYVKWNRILVSWLRIISSFRHSASAS